MKNKILKAFCIGAATVIAVPAIAYETATENADGTPKKPMVLQTDKQPQHEPRTLWHIERSLSWMTPKEEVQAAVFAHIEEKVGHKITLPDYPKDSPQAIIDWYHTRWFDFTQVADKKAYAKKNLDEIYTRHTEDLLVVQQCLKSTDFWWRQKGQSLARMAALRGPLYTEDTWLGARIYEGFILPHMDLAYDKPWYGQSWSYMLQDAAARFERNKEYESQFKILKLHLYIETIPNRRDRSRNELAWTLEKLERYDEAITVWQSVEDKSMRAGADEIEKLKTKMAAQKDHKPKNAN